MLIIIWQVEIRRIIKYVLLFQQVMALRGRSGKDVKKSSYYVWYLGAREAKGVDAMPGAIDYLLERERLQEPFKVTLQVSNRRLHQPLPLSYRPLYMRARTNGSLRFHLLPSILFARPLFYYSHQLRVSLTLALKITVFYAKRFHWVGYPLARARAHIWLANLQEIVYRSLRTSLCTLREPS
jgi:hypothetical protein